MANKILHAAIHDLERGSEGFRVNLGKDQLAVTATTQRVIDDLYDLYSRRASKSHGKILSQRGLCSIVHRYGEISHMSVIFCQW
jgi:hypothetical protein